LKRALKRCNYLSRNSTVCPYQPSNTEMNKLVNIHGEPLLNISSEEEIREKHFTQLSILWEGKFAGK